MATVNRATGPRPENWLGTALTPPTGATKPDLRPTAAAPPPPYGPAAVTRYACAVCGYAEEWVEQEADLVIIRLLSAGPTVPLG
jgi:hypothetical protein